MIRDEMIMLVVVKSVFSILSLTRKCCRSTMLFLRDESQLSAASLQLVWLCDACGITSVLLLIRECFRHEIGTDVSVNAGEFVGAVRFLTGGVLTCAHNSVSVVHEPHC